MKTTTAQATPPATPPAPPPPAFEPTQAVAVSPRRHDATARTVGFVQGTHLFSATRDFIATVPAAVAESFTAKAQPEPESAPTTPAA